jgi:cbb3-type cytochrome c oxidase subunit II
LEKKPSLVLLVAFTLFIVGVIGTVILPYFDGEINEPTANAEARNYKVDSAEARGREVYIQNGCQTCHTQFVRSVQADINQNLGPATAGGDYKYDLPHLMGSNRTGPDLMWVGTRWNESWQRQHLIDPQSTSPGSIMPSFAYLSEQEMKDLIAYLMSLKPADAKPK